MPRNFPNNRDVERACNTTDADISSLQSLFASPYVTQVDSLPACTGANEGQSIFTTDGASGEPIACFCNSAFWARTDTSTGIELNRGRIHEIVVFGKAPTDDELDAIVA